MTYGTVALCVGHRDRAASDILLPEATESATLKTLRRHMASYTDTSQPIISALLKAAAAEIDKTHEEILRTYESMRLTSAHDDTVPFVHKIDGPPVEGVFVVDTHCAIDDCAQPQTHQICLGPREPVTLLCERHYRSIVRGEELSGP